MKISGQIEQIFAHAVALEQNGNLKNSIYVIGKEIYIVNFDHTVLIRFRLRDNENPFSESLSFKANDYDSNEFYLENGKIVFVSSLKGFERKKVCGTAEYTPEEMKKVFKKYVQDESPREPIILSEEILPLFDEDLSHIEFSGEKGGKFQMLQRNIYSGGIISVSEKKGSMFQQNVLKTNLTPIGIKTKDFIALFTFQNTLTFEFPTKNGDFILVRSIDKNKRDMTAVIGCCIYDELIELQTLKK